MKKQKDAFTRRQEREALQWRVYGVVSFVLLSFIPVFLFGDGSGFDIGTLTGNIQNSDSAITSLVTTVGKIGLRVIGFAGIPVGFYLGFTKVMNAQSRTSWAHVVGAFVISSLSFIAANMLHG